MTTSRRLAVATLCAYHDELAPETLTSLLGLQPTSSHDVATHPLDPAPNGWFLEFDDRETADCLKPAMNALLLAVRARRRRFRVAVKLGWEFRIMCFAQIPPHQAFEIAPEDARVLGELGIRINFFIA